MCIYIYVYQVGSVLIGFVPLIFVPLNWCLSFGFRETMAGRGYKSWV